MVTTTENTIQNIHLYWNTVWNVHKYWNVNKYWTSAWNVHNSPPPLPGPSPFLTSRAWPSSPQYSFWWWVYLIVHILQSSISRRHILSRLYSILKLILWEKKAEWRKVFWILEQLLCHNMPTLKMLWRQAECQRLRLKGGWHTKLEKSSHTEACTAWLYFSSLSFIFFVQSLPLIHFQKVTCWQCCLIGLTCPLSAKYIFRFYIQLQFHAWD